MIRIGELPFNGRSLLSSRKKNGNEHSTNRRCKRRRHVKKVSSSNWGGPTRSVGTVSTVSCGARRNVQCHGDVEAGVGEGHSSKEGGGQHNPVERRAISLRMLFKESEGQA